MDEKEIVKEGLEVVRKSLIMEKEKLKSSCPKELWSAVDKYATLCFMAGRLEIVGKAILGGDDDGE